MNQLAENMHQSSYLTFGYKSYLYAVDISDVQEIVSLPKIFPVPQGESMIIGLINLRGQVISVVDMSQLLSFSELEKTESTGFVESVKISFLEDSKNHKIVVCRCGGNLMALKADIIGDIYSDIDPVLKDSTGGLVQGFLKTDQRIFNLIDLNKISNLLEEKTQDNKESL